MLVGLKRYEEAWDLMDGFDEEHHLTNDTLLSQEAKRMLDYSDILAVAHEDERSAYQLDSTEVADLDALILNRYDRPAIWISSLLCMVYGHCRPPMTGGGGEPKRQILRAPDASKPGIRDHLSVQPNPASTSVSFAYSLSSLPNECWLTVTDLMGRTIHRQSITQQQGSAFFTVENLAAGVYTVSVAQSGEVLLSDLMVVQQ